MKLDAVLHIPMSEYCCGLDERRIVYRLRCAKGDMKRVTLFYADTACRVNPILFTSVPMEKILSDACHDYWQVIVDSPYNRVYYYFQLDDGAETTLYTAISLPTGSRRIVRNISSFPSTTAVTLPACRRG